MYSPKAKKHCIDLGNFLNLEAVDRCFCLNIINGFIIVINDVLRVSTFSKEPFGLKQSGRTKRLRPCSRNQMVIPFAAAFQHSQKLFSRNWSTPVVGLSRNNTLVCELKHSTRLIFASFRLKVFQHVDFERGYLYINVFDDIVVFFNRSAKDCGENSRFSHG
jgi:hypothetical protein